MKTFGLAEDGRTLRRFRERVERLIRLTISCEFDGSLVGGDSYYLDQTLVVRRAHIPKQKELRFENAGVQWLDGIAPYGMELAGDFWDYLSEQKNRLQVPVEHLKLFVDRPLGWDYLLFLMARARAARRQSTVPHNSLLELFRDNPNARDRDVFRELEKHHREVVALTGIKASLFPTLLLPSTGGRPKKQWELVVHPWAGA